MAFTGNEGQFITLTEATAWITNYGNIKPAGAHDWQYYAGTEISAILNQTSSAGMRNYYGITGSGQQVIVVVGVDASENDLYNGLLAGAPDLHDASVWTSNYRDAKAAGAPNGHFFGEEKITAIIEQTGCIGIRLYHAIDDLGIQQLIAVGMDSSGNPLWNGLLCDRSIQCPPTCGSSNALNS